MRKLWRIWLRRWRRKRRKEEEWESDEGGSRCEGSWPANRHMREERENEGMQVMQHGGSAFFWKLCMRIMCIGLAINIIWARKIRCHASIFPFLFCLSYYHSSFQRTFPFPLLPLHARQARVTASSQFVRSLSLLSFFFFPFFLSGWRIRFCNLHLNFVFFVFFCGIQIFLLGRSRSFLDVNNLRRNSAISPAFVLHRYIMRKFVWCIGGDLKLIRWEPLSWK